MGWVLNRVSITDGLYRGLLTGEGEPPGLEITLDGQVLGNLTPSKVDAGWQVEGELGTAPLTDGAQTIVIREQGGDVLDSFTILCGLGAPEDLRAELGALREEVAILKRAFRRHVAKSP